MPTGKHLSEAGKGVALTMDVESRSLVEQRAIRLHATGAGEEASDAGGVCSSAVYWARRLPNLLAADAAEAMEHGNRS